MDVLIGASRIKKILQARELQLDEAVNFIQLLWPEISARRARLMFKYPEELRVSGSRLSMPDSWEDL